jgi:integrase
MPKPSKYPTIQCDNFCWVLRRRNGIYVADGRSSDRRLGRYSLGTEDLSQAKAELRKLDRIMAGKLGLIKSEEARSNESETDDLSFATGRKLFEGHITRPEIVGGVSDATAKRYRAVLDKFSHFASKSKIATWNEVNADLVHRYAAHLERKQYRARTLYFEINTIKQVVKFLVKQRHLPQSALLDVPMPKPQGTNRYCYSRDEVSAMIEHCLQRPDLAWLHGVITALACTGLRISELASLRWSDIVMGADGRAMLCLSDESAQAGRDNPKARRTKSRRTRSFPIHPALQKLLDTMPKSTDGRIFHGPLGGKIKPDTIRRIFVRDVLKPLAEQFPGVPGEPSFIDGRLHSFRHYFCSECARQQVPIQVLKQWLGHQDSEMIAHYFHLHDRDSQRQMDQLKLVD